MQFPFTPTAVNHKHGGTVTRIDRIEHGCDKPEDGRSRDYWHFVGAVKWSDGSSSDALEIAPFSLCYGKNEAKGHEEIGDLLAALNTYLAEHGEWHHDGKTKHEGWYAHRKVRRAA